MSVFLRKSTFCPKLTQILDLEETETNYGQSLAMYFAQHLLLFSNGVILLNLRLELYFNSFWRVKELVLNTLHYKPLLIIIPEFYAHISLFST